MANIMERANMWMIEARDHARLALETVAGFGAVGQTRRKNLNCNNAIQPGVASPIHFAHAALSDFLFNPIGPELFANPDRCLGLERSAMFQKALATLPCWTIEERAVFLRGIPFLPDALLSQDCRNRCTQLGVGPFQQRGSLGRRQGPRRLIQLLCLSPTLGRHGGQLISKGLATRGRGASAAYGAAAPPSPLPTGRVDSPASSEWLETEAASV